MAQINPMAISQGWMAANEKRRQEQQKMQELLLPKMIDQKLKISEEERRFKRDMFKEMFKHKLQTKTREMREGPKLEAAMKQQKQVEDFAKSQAQDTLSTIGEIKKGINYFGATGPVPTVNPFAYDRKLWEANIQKLLSKRIVDLMTTMKQASKTGATGFGQLSNKELKVLQDASTALKRGLSPQQAMKILTDMENSAKRILGYQEGQVQPTNINQESTDGNVDSEYQRYLNAIGAENAY